MRKLFSLLLILLLATQADIYAKKVKHLTPTITWELKDDGTLVISGTGEMPTMPRNEYPWAKKKKKITAVHISEGITKIGNLSFYNWPTDKKKYRISKIKLPSTLQSIGEDAFYCNNITTLTIPEGVKEIQEWAFASNNINQVKLPSTLQSIGEAAFKANNISTLTIPEGVKEIHIGENAFFRNNITTLTVPEGVKEIGKSAFKSNKISTLSVSAKEIGEDAFRNNPICNLNIGKEVRKIGKEAFAGNSIKDLSIPNTVKSIGRDAFAQHNGKSWQPYNGHLAKISNWLTDKDCEVIGISKSSIDKYRGPRAKDLYYKGLTHSNKEEYNSAEGQFAKGIDAYQDSLYDKNYKALCYAMWGVCLYKQGYYNIALDKFEEAVKLGETETPRIYIALMVHIYHDRGELQKALELAERAHELGGSDIMVTLIKHQISREKEINDLLKSGQYNKLFDKVCTYVDIDHRDFKIIDQYLVDRKDYANVVKFYKKVYDKTKNSTLVNKIASMYLTLKDYTNAIEWYSIKAQQGDKETQYKLGQVYEKANNKNLAIFWYRKAAEQKHLKAEEALAHYGVYITPQQNTSKAQASNSSSSSSSTTKNNGTSQTKSTKSTYTPEYGFRDVWVQCAQCHGSGKCWSCHGNGWCVSTRYDGSYNSTYQCPICNGTGNCTTCFGTGGHYEKQQYQIR